MPVRDSELVGSVTLDEFSRRAADLGVRVGAVADAESGAAWIASVLGELGLRSALVSGELRDAAPSLCANISAGDISLELPDGPQATRDAAIGISLGRMAIAETGSVLLAETTLADRSIGMLCKAQIIVCASDKLVARLESSAEALRAAATRPGAGMATLVTGPSRTADIERVLTVGVQGPGKVFVLFVDEVQ